MTPVPPADRLPTEADPASPSRRLPIDQCTLLVTGVVRNGERRMRRDLEALRRAVAGAGFRRVRWLVIESDSDDRTVPVLQALQAEWPDFDFLSLGRTRDHHPLRTDRIARSRNAYLAALDDDARLADVTHVLVADLDGVCGDLTAAALASCWQLAEPWSACMANQGDYYYDVWALRHPVWCPEDAWAQRNALLPLIGEAQADSLALFSRMVHIAPTLAPIEVDSAFGGLALYRRDALRGARYDGLDRDGAQLCEHVALHARLRADGHRLFIHPALVNARKTKHAGRKKFWRSTRRAVWNWVRGRPWR
jgi:hypothetical protein